MVQIEYLPIVLTGLSITASIIYYSSVLRNQNKMRKDQLAMNFYTHVTRREFWGQWVEVMFHQPFETLEEWDSKYGPIGNKEAATDFYSTMQVFEGAGTLLKENVIETDLLFRYLPKIIIRSTWERYEPWIKGIRIAYNDPMFGGMFEHFYNEAMRLYPNIKHPRIEENPEGPTLKKVQ